MTVICSISVMRLNKTKWHIYDSLSYHHSIKICQTLQLFFALNSNFVELLWPPSSQLWCLRLQSDGDIDEDISLSLKVLLVRDILT